MPMGEKLSRRGKMAEPSGQFQKWEARSIHAADQGGVGKDLKFLGRSTSSWEGALG